MSYQGPGKGHCGPRATLSHGETAGHPQAGRGQARRKAAGDLGREQGHMARPLDAGWRSPGFARGWRGSGRRERLSQVGAVGVGDRGDRDTRTVTQGPRTSAALCVQRPRLCAPATEKRALAPAPGRPPELSPCSGARTRAPSTGTRSLCGHRAVPMPSSIRREDSDRGGHVPNYPRIKNNLKFQNKFDLVLPSAFDVKLSGTL